MSDSLLLSDMSLAQPASAIQPVPDTEHWGLYDYATATVQGQAVYCRPFCNPPELTLPLPARGPHRIYPGIHYGHIHNSHLAKLGGQVVDQTLLVRLTGDRSHSLIEPEYYGAKAGGKEPFGFTDVVEVLWRCADVTDRALHFAPRRSPRCPGEAAGLAWVRLTPIASHEAEAETAPQMPDARRLVYVADTDLHEALLTAREHVQRLLDPLASSDFGLVLWMTSMGDVCYYPTQRFSRAYTVDGISSPYGYAPTPRTEDFDVLQTVCDTCHAMGLKVRGAVRPAASRMPPLHWPRGDDGLFHEHVEVWQRGPSGEAVGHYSFAHPLVRETFTEVLRELQRQAGGFRTVYPLVSAAGMSLAPEHTPGTNG